VLGAARSAEQSGQQQSADEGAVPGRREEDRSLEQMVADAVNAAVPVLPRRTRGDPGATDGQLPQRQPRGRRRGGAGAHPPVETRRGRPPSGHGDSPPAKVANTGEEADGDDWERARGRGHLTAPIVARAITVSANPYAALEGTGGGRDDEHEGSS
jgi:hypothetical protein